MTLANEPFILLEDSKSQAPGVRGYFYTAPDFTIECHAPDGLDKALCQIEEALAKGYHLAGWMAYECAYALEPKLKKLMPAAFSGPLLWFGAYKTRRAMTHQDLTRFWQEQARAAMPTHAISHERLSIDKDSYLSAIASIHDHLRAGDVYQINYTLKKLFDFEGDTASLYRRLRASQPVEFGAYIKTAAQTILSFSPELFLRRSGTKLFAKPMKGTASRGFLLGDDMANRAQLAADEKSRAENLMILDLLRNDLSRLARPRSVKTTAKFEVEAFRTLLQMTSSVEAEIADTTTFSDIVRALFPCGSITGAPKIRACEIIRALEKAPRGVYTGAIGYITPEQDFCFSVPIRTIKIAGDDSMATKRAGEMGIGGGIVADSEAEAEFQECLLKAKFAASPLPAFDLIETLLWQPGSGFASLSDHLTRLENSAEFFDFCYDMTEIKASLLSHAQSLPKTSNWRVRLVLSPESSIAITSTPLPDSPASGALPTIILSPRRIDSKDVLLYHKTTRRALYDDEFARLSHAKGCMEVIFANENGEITEGSRSNLFIEKDGNLLTPALQSGLLPGVLRAQLLQRKRNPAREAIITLDDLAAADKIFVGNALRGLTEVKLEPI